MKDMLRTLFSIRQKRRTPPVGPVPAVGVLIARGQVKMAINQPISRDFWNWMVLSGDRRQRTHQLGALIDGYEQFRSFDRRELALIEPLRTLRLIHYSAWLARRWQDPIFPANFPWFGSSDYWRGQVDMLIEQIEAMQEEPLVA